jgi:hypothetical protein
MHLKCKIYKKILLQNKSKAHIALLATNIFFAINFTAVKFLTSFTRKTIWVKPCCCIISVLASPKLFT